MRIVYILFGIIVVWFTLLFTVVLAEAQSFNHCAERELVVKRLAEKYGETQQAIGMANGGRLMEVYASDESGSWTILITTPDGVACLAATGQNYETGLHMNKPNL